MYKVCMTLQANINIKDEKLAKEFREFMGNNYPDLSNAQYFVRAGVEKMKRENGYYDRSEEELWVAGIKHTDRYSIEILKKGLASLQEMENIGASVELTNCITLMGDYIDYMSKKLTEGI